MPARVAIWIAVLLTSVAYPAQAQQSLPVPAMQQVRFESWDPGAFGQDSGQASGMLATVSRDAGHDWLIGGAVGAAAGIVFCTAMSTLMNDSAKGGLSLCPLDSYLIMGGSGFLLGAVIGLAI